MLPRVLLVAVALLVTACASAPAPEAPASRPAEQPPPDVAAEASPEPTTPPEGALVVWARGDLPASFAVTVAGLPDVMAAAHVRGSTLGLTATRDSAGTVVESYTDGFRVPVDVAAVDPEGYAATLADGGTAAQFADLTPGTVLLTTTATELRGVGGGATVDVGGATALRVVGILPDGATGRAEIVAHVADAGRLGLDDDGSVFIRHRASPGAATERLIDAVVSQVPGDLTARVVDVGSDGERRRAPLVLSLAQVKERFGELAFRPRPGQRGVDLAPGFVEEHIVRAEVPILGTVRCHRGIIDDATAALADIEAAGLADEVDPSRYAGCFNPRRISADGDRLSRHTWGIALDINVDLDAPGGGEVPHPEVIAAFERHGFRWGGDFLSPDNHHFEWIGTAG